MGDTRTVGKNQIAGMTLLEIHEFLVEEKSILPYNYKLPYMMWYEDNFVGSSEVREMQPVEEWMYRQLLAKAWVSKNSPYLPNDEEMLKRLSGCKDPKFWAKHSKIVLGMFEKTAGGEELFHPRQLIDYAVQITKIASNIANGSKGGRPKKRTVPTEEPKNNQSVSVSETQNNHMQRQLELEPKLELNLDLEQELNVGTEEILEEDGQDDMKIKKEIQAVCAGFGIKPGGYDDTWELMAALEKAHSRGAVVRGFTEYMEENQGDDFPKGAVAAYLQVAAARLVSGVSPVSVAAKAPEVVSLVRELTYLSDGKVKFADRQKPLLAELAAEYTESEILTVFKAWLGDQDLSDPRKIDFAAKNFVECADALCYSARRKKSERVILDTERELAKSRLQAEAEAERVAAGTEREKEELLFDPLGDTISE